MPTLIFHDTAYTEWLLKRVCIDKLQGHKYEFLLKALDNMAFDPLLMLDKNIVDNAIYYLRNVYTKEFPIEENDKWPGWDYISILEAIVLGVPSRVEKLYPKNDEEYKDKTSMMFWVVLSNLGVDKMDNDNFDEFELWEIIDKFNDRKFEKDGRGSFYTIRNPEIDMREVPIGFAGSWFMEEFRRPGFVFKLLHNEDNDEIMARFAEHIR